jgi:hypothetical protein
MYELEVTSTSCVVHWELNSSATGLIQLGGGGTFCFVVHSLYTYYKTLLLLFGQVFFLSKIITQTFKYIIYLHAKVILQTWAVLRLYIFIYLSHESRK